MSTPSFRWGPMPTTTSHVINGHKAAHNDVPPGTWVSVYRGSHLSSCWRLWL